MKNHLLNQYIVTEKIAEKICYVFGFESIYEYNPPDLIQVSSTVVVGKFSDEVDKNGNFIKGGGIHMDVAETEFECPICTCVQDATDHAIFNRSNNPVMTIKCKGCKRKLQLFSCPMTGKLTISEKILNK